MKLINNRGNKSNGGGFNRGSTPDEFGPDSGKKNVIGATSEPNKDKGQTYNEKLLNPRDPSLNAVPMPTKAGGEKNYGIFDKISTNSIGGTPRPHRAD